MNNNKILYQAYTIVDYLKKHDGYKYKIHSNYSSDYDESNIVEYAENIYNYLKDLLENNDKGKYIINEICKIFLDNLTIFNASDSKSKKLKTYVTKHYDEGIKETPNDELMELCEEALIDLLSSDYLYDFRD